MINVQRRAMLQLASLAWAAALPLAGCADDDVASAGSRHRILDDKSPFAELGPDATRRCTDADHDAAIAAWTKLRKQDYPYHLQAVALSPPFPSGCRALIVAEPPPAVSLEVLRDIEPRLMARSEIRQHEVGYDGWTRDVVVTLPPVQDAELTELIADLHNAMFETSYRMEPLDTSQPPPTYDPSSAPMDIGIGPGELHRWLITEPTAFAPLDGGDPVSFKDLLVSDEPEVYLDDDHGLVVWIVPRRADLAQMAGVFRQFTLESDLIVGAMASAKTVAIIARQRAIDPRVLQPLRFETVSLLAAVHDKLSLGQSFERLHPLAGQIDETRDWAPIFLSSELLDTEYGSLLNIADQFLKSWSNNGKTQYVNLNYALPSKWAFPKPVFIIAGSRRFIYNWNTGNVGAVVNVDDIDVFWLRRTGALNVSYFPDEDELVEHRPRKQAKVRELEDTAYQFFAETQTPMLVRVVQYNALFQIFARFGVVSSMTVSTSSRAAAEQVLVAATRDGLIALRDADDAKIQRGLAGILPPQTTYVVDERASRSWRVAAKQLARLAPDRLAELSDMIGGVGSRGCGTEPASDLSEICKQLRELGPLPQLANPDVYKAYAENSKTAPGAWIHTPSIVVSWNRPPIEDWRGGHNLDAKVAELKFHADRSAVAAHQVARHVAVDAVGANELARLELGPRGPTLAPAPTSRATRVALGSTRQRRYWPIPTHRRDPLEGGIHVVKLGDGYRITDRSGASHEVATTVELADLLGNQRAGKGKQIAIAFDNMTADEVRRVLRGAERQIGAEIAGVVKSRGFADRPLDFKNAVLRETQFRVYRDGAGQVGQVIEIGGLSIEVRIGVRNATQGRLRALGAKIRSVIKSLLDWFSTGPSARRVSSEEFGLELRKRLNELLQGELRPISGGAKHQRHKPHRIELRMQREATDMTIVQREPPASHGTRALAG